MRRFDPAVNGAASTVHKFNRLVAGIKELNTFVGDGLILVNRTATGYTLSLNMPALLSRIPKVGGGGLAGSQVKLARCKEDAQSRSYIKCNLFDDNGAETSSPIWVQCTISGGNTNLDHCFPRLVSGDKIFVTYIYDRWWCVTTFQTSTRCP